MQWTPNRLAPVLMKFADGEGDKQRWRGTQKCSGRRGRRSGLLEQRCGPRLFFHQGPPGSPGKMHSLAFAAELGRNFVPQSPWQTIFTCALNSRLTLHVKWASDPSLPAHPSDLFIRPSPSSPSLTVT